MSAALADEYTYAGCRRPNSATAGNNPTLWLAWPRLSSHYTSIRRMDSLVDSFTGPWMAARAALSRSHWLQTRNAIVVMTLLSCALQQQAFAQSKSAPAL